MTVTDQGNREDARDGYVDNEGGGEGGVSLRRFEMRNCRRGFRNGDRYAPRNHTRLRNRAGFYYYRRKTVFSSLTPTNIRRAEAHASPHSISKFVRRDIKF